MITEGLTPELRLVFASLNREWIEAHWKLEPRDLEELSKPESLIAVGGQIFFAGELGTCALIPHGDGYELVKMAVSPRARGQGLGSLLMSHAIEWARARGAREIHLLSNTILGPAISLYRKHGFEIVNLGPHPEYERCNIEMKLRL